MANFTVVYDACLLYPASIRDLVVELARNPTALELFILTPLSNIFWTSILKPYLKRSGEFAAAWRTRRAPHRK
jgi:hypothetical protein